MKEKTYQVVLSDDKESTFELRSASHWCEQCLLFVYDMMVKKVYSTTHNGDVQSLRQSSASGCHMCEMILDRCHPDQRDFYLQRTGKKRYGVMYANTEHAIELQGAEFNL